MFFKDFVCGWLGMVAIASFLMWGLTPRVTPSYVDYITNGQPEAICEARDC